MTWEEAVAETAVRFPNETVSDIRKMAAMLHATRSYFELSLSAREYGAKKLGHQSLQHFLKHLDDVAGNYRRNEFRLAGMDEYQLDELVNKRLWDLIFAWQGRSGPSSNIPSPQPPKSVPNA